MRIVSGKYKGRIIKATEGIRPTEDKVRKALFDILGDIQGLSFLELYAGSGAIGLEALSRGAVNLTLVERNSGSLLAIKDNIESLGEKGVNVCPKDAELAVKEFFRLGRKFDLIFLDPPYYKDKPAGPDLGAVADENRASPAKKTLQTLGACDILTPCGFIIVQHHKMDKMPEVEANLVLARQYRYSQSLVTFYRKKEA